MIIDQSRVDIATLLSRIKSGDLDLQPEFQRGQVWPDSKKFKLIDTILRNWYIPAIHVVVNEDLDREEVLDGQQRLQAILEFFNGDFTVDGNILPHDPEIVSLGGLTYKDLPNRLRSRFKRFPIETVTTHSSGIVSFLSDGDVISLSRLAGVTTLPGSTEAKAKVLAKLGLLPKRPVIGFVEDAVGKALLEELLDQFGFPDVMDIDIVIVQEGAGGIKTILEFLPPNPPLSGVFGFLDGDMEKDAKKWPCRGRLFFLPVSQAPEVEFLAALEKDPGAFADRFSRPLDKLNRVLGETRGHDHHDRFLSVGKAMGFDGPSFTKAAFRHYLAQGDEERAGAIAFANELAARLEVTPPDLP